MLMRNDGVTCPSAAQRRRTRAELCRRRLLSAHAALRATTRAEKTAAARCGLHAHQRRRNWHRQGPDYALYFRETHLPRREPVHLEGTIAGPTQRVDNHEVDLRQARHFCVPNEAMKRSAQRRVRVPNISASSCSTDGASRGVGAARDCSASARATEASWGLPASRDSTRTVSDVLLAPQSGRAV